MDAKKYMCEYQKCVLKIKNKLAEIEILDSIRTGTSAPMSGERVQTSGSKDKAGDATARIVDLKNEIIECEMVQKEITDTIEQLKSDEYDVLHKRYVQDMTYKEIGFFCGYDKDWATTKHGRALQSLQRILDERNDGWYK